ncbi:hypothetical protein HHE014_10580 [Helicobacter heilmannii]|nr:hypothetical protein HHE014_10580 [Helicobacter heilmannii]
MKNEFVLWLYCAIAVRKAFWRLDIGGLFWGVGALESLEL